MELIWAMVINFIRTNYIKNKTFAVKFINQAVVYNLQLVQRSIDYLRKLCLLFSTF